MDGWKERRMSVPLLDDNNLVCHYIAPLVLLEHNTLLDEFKDDFIGVYHDGTTYMGESFCIIFRCVKADFTFVLWVVKLPCCFRREPYSGIHLDIIKVSLVAVKKVWI